jgi:hypothetical protein
LLLIDGISSAGLISLEPSDKPRDIGSTCLLYILYLHYLECIYCGRKTTTISSSLQLIIGITVMAVGISDQV